MKTKLFCCFWVFSLTLAFERAKTGAQAADAFFTIPWASLQSTAPSQGEDHSGRFSGSMGYSLQWHATLEGEGEVYVNDPQLRPWIDRFSTRTIVAIRAPQGTGVVGRVWVSFSGTTHTEEFKLELAATDAKPEARAAFFEAKRNHYQRLLDANVPGAAWFRHQAREAATQSGKTNETENEFRLRSGGDRPSELEDTYDLFTGGRAMSENLQLDRVLPTTKTGEATVPLTNLPGITVKEMDWKALGTDTNLEIDPLAAYIPADQHAIFFPSFQAMTEIIDEADANGTPVLQLLEPRSEDTGARDRYQKQLCLGLSEVSRMLGPAVVASMACTGSDPFLRVGTDLAILFESRNPELLKTTFRAQQKLAQTADPTAKSVQGSVAGVAYSGVVTPGRSVCSYVASVSNVVIVCNSTKQLENLVRAAQGKTPALIFQDEYRFFRARYSRGDKTESAFVVLTDAAIRRWCGPRWRIADSRRTRTAAAMAELQAANLPTLLAGLGTNQILTTDFNLPDAGELRLSGRGVASETYGTLNFMTPIVELPLTEVTREEARAYERWRDSYQNNWRQFFDPIAMRYSLSRTQLSAEITVMPLIVGTDYRSMLEMSTGAQIAPMAGDPHPNALLHAILAINSQSAPVQDAGNFVGNMVPGLKSNPLGWVGQSISLYADADAFWGQLQQATNADEFLEANYPHLPIALHIEVKNPLGLTVFLTGLRAYVDQTAPQMTSWQNMDYQGQPYVKITPKDSDTETDWKDLAIYYAATPRSLIVTLSEPVLKRALERQAARTSTNEIARVPMGVPPWLGTNLCLRLERDFITAIQSMTRDSYQARLQELAWSNLPILNEWKRLCPDKDPVQVHETFWGTTLRCPGGGKYVWNAKYQTMESTVFGHPAEPKTSLTSAAMRITRGQLGVSFEQQGLSAKAILDRMGEN